MLFTTRINFSKKTSSKYTEAPTTSARTSTIGRANIDQLMPRGLQVMNIHPIILIQCGCQPNLGLDNFCSGEKIVHDEDAVAEIGVDLLRS
jgi:hypothetical protein